MNIIEPDDKPSSSRVPVGVNQGVIAYEPYVDEHAIARFLQLSPRRILEMARSKEIPAHPIGHTRKTWRFRLSEIDAHFSAQKVALSDDRMWPAVPGTQERKKKLG